MTLLELFLEYGDPSKSYSDEVLGCFLGSVDDGTLFMEAIAEMPDAQRLRIADLVDDRTSRTLSYQNVGQAVVEQLRRYTRDYLQRKYEELEGDIIERRNRAADDAKADREMDAKRMDEDFGDAKGQMP